MLSYLQQEEEQNKSIFYVVSTNIPPNLDSLSLLFINEVW